MSNEDKILALLEKQGAMLEKQGAVLEEHSAILEKQGAVLEEHSAILEKQGAMLEEHSTLLGKLVTDVAETKQRIILMENDNNRNFGALHDGHKLVYDKLEPIPVAVETLQEDVSVVKAVVTNHSKDINVLKAAT